MSVIAKWGRRGSVACEGVKKNYTPFSSLTSRGKSTFCKYRKWQDVCMGNCKSSSKTSAVSKKMTTATKPPLRTFLQGLSYQFLFLGSLCSSLNLLCSVPVEGPVVLSLSGERAMSAFSPLGSLLEIIDFKQIRAEEMIEGLCRSLITLSTIM